MGFFSRLFALDGEAKDELGDDLREALAILVKRAMRDGGVGFTLNIWDCTIREIPVGDWRIVVERIAHNEKKQGTNA